MSKNSLAVLYEEFDRLYADIGPICSSCNFHDCEGYVWLIDQEAELLYNSNVPIVVINDNLCFIHSFEESDGKLIVDQPKPPCVWRKNGLCTIYQLRPLVCRMYPVGLADQNGTLMLVLHQDCQFSKILSGESKISFFQTVVDILCGIPQASLREIVDKYRAIDGISAFPEGGNTYEIITPIDEILQKGATSNV